MPGKFECGARDPPHLVTAVDFRVEGVSVLDTAGQPKVNAAQQFADNQQVHAADGIPAKRRAIHQCFKNRHRPEVRIVAEQPAEVQQPALGFFRRRPTIVFRIADSSKENRGRCQANLLSAFRKWFAVALNRDRADIGLDELKFVVVFPADDFENPAGFPQHLRADPITRQTCNSRFHVWKLSPDHRLSSCGRPPAGMPCTPVPALRG